MIVTLCGIDSAGKNTQVNQLCGRLTKFFQKPVNKYDFPHYSTSTGSLIKKLLTEELVISSDVKPLILQALMTANRYECYSSLKEYSGSSSRHIVLDRYYVSGIVYGQADGLDKQHLIDLHAALPRSDVTFLIDITPEESVRRRPIRRDEYESRAGFLHKVRDLYLDWFITQTSKDTGWWRIIDGSQDEKTINDEIYHVVEEYYIQNLVPL